MSIVIVIIMNALNDTTRYGWQDMMNLLPYGERFRTQRRMMQQTFNSQNVKVYRESQKKRVVGLMKDLLDDDQSWIYSVRQ